MKSILKWLLKKDFNELTDEISKLKHKLYFRDLKIKELEKKNKDIYSLLGYILSYKKNTIIGIDVNKRDQTVFVVKSESGSNLEISLYSLKYDRRTPIIYASKHEHWGEYSTSDEPDYFYLHIDNIYAIDQNIGNGHILMKYLIEYAKKENYSHICGILSTTDEEHFEKLEYFYKKHGFEVSSDDKRRKGSIKLDLINL